VELAGAAARVVVTAFTSVPMGALVAVSAEAYSASRAAH